MRLRDSLAGKLTPEDLALVPSSFDMIGSIAIFSDLPRKLIKQQRTIGEAIIANQKPITTVLRKTGRYAGRYRTPTLVYMAGKKTKETLHKENGIMLSLNVEKVYFSPRTGSERLRIAHLVKPDEDVLVMFSGCAPFNCVISRHSKAKSVIGVELNPVAHTYGLENVALNKLRNVGLIKGDVKKVLPKLKKTFDRVIMPLPRSAEKYLSAAIPCVKKQGMLHFYSMLNEADIGGMKKTIIDSCKTLNRKAVVTDVVTCGHFGPSIYRYCFDVRIN